MVHRAEWNCEGIRDFASKSARLGKFEVVRLGWLSFADEAGLTRNKPKVIWVAEAPRFGNR